MSNSIDIDPDIALVKVNKWHQKQAHAGFDVQWTTDKTHDKTTNPKKFSSIAFSAVRKIKWWYDSKAKSVDGTDISTMCNTYDRYNPSDKSDEIEMRIPFKSRLEGIWGEIHGYLISMITRDDHIGFVPMPGDPDYDKELARYNEPGYGLHAMDSDGFHFQFEGPEMSFEIKFNEHGSCMDVDGDHGRGYSQARYLVHQNDKKFLDLAFCRLDEIYNMAKQEEV